MVMKSFDPSGSSAKATQELADMLKRQHEQNSRQAAHLIRLTYAIVGLTVVMIAVVIVQVWLERH